LAGGVHLGDERRADADGRTGQPNRQALTELGKGG
jgi:hypothetical protein